MLNNLIIWWVVHDVVLLEGNDLAVSGGTALSAAWYIFWLDSIIALSLIVYFLWYVMSIRYLLLKVC